ncbi:MAG: rod shape-determining protein MreC [Planctomycetales bacterium]|jgi:cell shape-determining protein MreC
MTESHQTGTFRVLAACLLGAAMFAVLPASATTPIRDIIRLAVAPGQRLVTSAVATTESRWQQMLNEKLVTQRQQLDQLYGEIAQSQLRERRAWLVAESASQELASVRRNGATPFAVETAQPLLRPHAIRAAVLGREILSELKSRRILDRGDTDGVAADLWVLNGEFPIVQAGSELSVADGLPVFAGRCIVGRIVDAGRWTSSLQFVTEPGFRARAVIARVNTDGPTDNPNSRQFSFGAEGLIEGRSDLKQQGLCELAQIPATEQVDVGMSVYSPPGHAVDAPMLFGHVVSAEVPPGALHWVINVRPAADLDHVRNVEIVVPKLSTDFKSSNPDADLAGARLGRTSRPVDSQSAPGPQSLTPSARTTGATPTNAVSQQNDSSLSGNVPLRHRGGSDS